MHFRSAIADARRSTPRRSRAGQVVPYAPTSARTRLAVLVAGAITASCLVFAPAPHAVADPPPNPSDQQLTSAQSQKDQLAGQVGSLSAKVASIKSQIDQLNLRAELAEQKLADALTKLSQAKNDATQAKQQVDSAQAAVAKAQSEFSVWVHDTYINGTVTGLAGSLLTAPDPSALLERSSYENYVAANQLDALGGLDRATLAKSNADASARLAVQRQSQLTDQAKQAQADAKQALADARTAQDALNAQLDATQAQLTQAQTTLASLNNQRAAYNAYVAEQQRLAAERAAAEAAARQRQAELAAERARQAQQAQSAGSSGSSGTSGSSGQSSYDTSGGWTAAKGQQAVARIRQYLGWPYSFAAGNYYGPTYGVAVDYDSRNDGGVYGFDCSGLSMYAWGPWLHMDHFAATQYWQAGSYHPSVGDLMPGDLVFWSEDGTQSGIGHVAIYIGGGNVIQAPHSGAYIEVTPLFDVESGYYGATRPLT